MIKIIYPCLAKFVQYFINLWLVRLSSSVYVLLSMSHITEQEQLTERIILRLIFLSNAHFYAYVNIYQSKTSLRKEYAQDQEVWRNGILGKRKHWAPEKEKVTTMINPSN